MRAIENDGEPIGRDFGRPAHEGQLVIDLSDQGKIGPAPIALGQQVERHVAIAAEAIAVPPSRDDLRHDIDALVDQIAHRMGIIGCDIVALRVPIAEPAAGLEEKFIHLDIGRHLACALRLRIGKAGISAHCPLEHGLEETTLEVRAKRGLLERERREDTKPDGGISAGTGEEGIDDMRRLAKAQRQAKDDMPVGASDDAVGYLFCRTKFQGLDFAGPHCSMSQPGSGRNRSPWASRSPSSTALTSPTPRARA
ncbi:hypothetical protein P7B04_19485 [Sphingobium yanoikuyae]|nr:hypothetical protein [Sphingobium yanoikuyae]